MQDVIIVGGGPAGLHAAARLSASGFRTTLIEEHAEVGQPVHCTGVLAAEAFAEFNLPVGAVLNDLTTARFWSPAGREITYTSGKVEAVVIDRSVFDRELLTTAEKAGVVVHSGTRATAVSIDAAGVSVSSSAGIIRGRLCILACGANYALHRQVGLGMPQLFLQTAQLELPAGCPGDVELHFGDAVAPKGFGWVVPVSRKPVGCARVGVMCDRDAPVHFERLIERVAPRWDIPREAVSRPRQKILPLAPIPRTYGDRLLAIGDAAGLVKPTTGGGIYYSLVSAALAAGVAEQALVEDNLSAERLAPYERRWRGRLQDEFQAQLSFRLFAHRMTDADIDQLFELARTDGVMPIVRRTASFNRHRRLIVDLLKHPPVRQILLRRLAF